MALLSHKALLAITVVADVAFGGRTSPISTKALARRNSFHPRYFDKTLQALVHAGILIGIRGPRGGYQLACDPKDISMHDILEAVVTVEDEYDILKSKLIRDVVLPAVAPAENSFASALCRIDLGGLLRRQRRVRLDARALRRSKPRRPPVP